MKYRKLRIAWSVGWGVVAVLLIALWVRGYHFRDHYQRWFSAAHGLTSDSEVGTLYISWRVGHNPRPYNVLSSTELDVADLPLLQRLHSQQENVLGFGIGRRIFPADPRSGSGITSVYSVTLPYWFLVLVAAILPILAWLPWRFSLRTLLIATTLIATAMGFIVYMANK